jgi:Flp pilus assembly protein TadD
MSTAQCWLIALSVFALSGCRKSDDARTEVYVPRAKGTVTFNKDIAPIVFQNCASCHHPGGSAPFDLIAYDDVRKRAKQIVDVTQSRTMPPWLPDPNVVHLIGERRLTGEQIGLLQQWAQEGAGEGLAKDLPPVPQWNERWQLGEPDLVVKPAVAYTLAADGRDVYRNLVIAIPISARRYVRAIDFRPNTRAVHHAFFRFDKTSQTRALDGKDGQPGFGGVHGPRSAESPITFASWQPGRVARFYAEDLVWPLEPNTDLLLQLHLQPIGKVETVAPEVALYLTDKPGTAIAMKLPLDSYTIDIPPGASHHIVTDSFVTPVDLELRGILPHAHYLAKEMNRYADFPDGKRQWLMVIKNWDFNWQGDYQYPSPISLPKGTRLTMEWAYDNSANNPRNPNQPPRNVIYGMNTTDEMAELWLQVVMKSQADFSELTRALHPRLTRDILLANEALLRRNPRDAHAHCEIGMALAMSGKPQEAMPHLRASVELDPAYDEAHYFLGLALRMTKQLPEAQREFEAALQLNPRHARARGNLGLVLVEMGNYAGAIGHFEMALQLNPDDQIARNMLKQIRQQATRPPQ